MIPAVEPIPVSRPLLFGLVAVGAVVAATTGPPTSSFAAGFAAGAGTVFVISFMRGRVSSDASASGPGADSEP